ncbi:MAG: glycerophosphodiester phosphodiesterase family protein [Syntrophales bacterium]|nr:glycerophosphodiester phosphodiesterase family protein [Syntrophales bacterium]
MRSHQLQSIDQRSPVAHFLKIAHRGYSEIYPENTILAFEKAIEAGADMIELDIRLSRDHRLVVIHDNCIDRTSDGSGYVEDLTLAELRRYNYNNGMATFGFVGIPTLDEVIDLAYGRVMLNVEIKSRLLKRRGIERRLVDLLREKNFIDRTIVSSFDKGILKALKRIDANVRTGFLYESKKFYFRRTVQSLGVYSLHPAVDAIDPGQLEWAKNCGLMIYPWVVRDRKTLEVCQASGFIDGAIANDLNLFKSL